MSWNEQAGSVTRAFDDWRLTDRDIRAFLKISNQFVQKEYQRIWDELANSPGDPDGPDLPSLFHDVVEGLWPSDHEWMLLSSVVKDGVTAFEVYLGEGGQRGAEGPWAGGPGGQARLSQLG
jgi:hypothetical protein